MHCSHDDDDGDAGEGEDDDDDNDDQETGINVFNASLLQINSQG